MNVWEDGSVSYDLTGLRCFDRLHSRDRLEHSLGTLGGGNHFIEVDEDDSGERYLVIHSGSRNLGHQVATHYQRLAADELHGDGEYDALKKEMIATYKAQGRKRELREALLALENEYKRRRVSVPRDLSYLSGERLDDYLYDLAICQRFADDSRRRMAQIILSECNLEPIDSFTTIHNYIDLDGMILRKGAVSARRGERLLIPINMRDGSLICIGKGNEDWNCSAPHGAGRLMSRNVAFERLTMEEYRRSMQGIYSTTVTPETLDESPMAYKSIDEIVENIEPTAEIVKRIRPIYNFKAAE
jgi:RNA-splicing ligase RtcB